MFAMLNDRRIFGICLPSMRITGSNCPTIITSRFSCNSYTSNQTVCCAQYIADTIDQTVCCARVPPTTLRQHSMLRHKVRCACIVCCATVRFAPAFRHLAIKWSWAQCTMRRNILYVLCGRNVVSGRNTQHHMLKPHDWLVLFCVVNLNFEP